MNVLQRNLINDEQQVENSAFKHEQQILNTSSIGVLITRIGNGIILYANKAIATLLGISDVSPVIGTMVPDFYWDSEDRNAILTRFRAEGSISNNELRARRADGSMIWVSISIQPFVYEGEQVLLSEIVDISKRKQTEEALYASQEQFRTLYDNATIGLYRTTPDGSILMINPTGLRLLGFDSFEELSKRNLEEAGFEQENARKEFREKLEREGVISDLESEWTRKDGSTIFVREGSKVIYDENGQVMYYDGSFEDITEQKRTEQALHRSEERFRRFTEVTIEGLVFHERGTIIDVNPAALAMFGIPDNLEFIGRNLLEFIVPESHQLVLQQMQLETVLPYEIQCVRNDGTIFPVETSTHTYKTGDQIIRASSITDITERKKLELQIQQAFERRGYQVQISTEISQEVASASELSDLFSRVVTLTKERLGYYHTQLLRYDANRDAVVLISGYGEIGQKMLAGGHQMPMGEGLIGTAAASGETVLRPTLADDPDWQPNPLLPDTQGEIAVPIKWQNTVLGVLDVQSNQAGALTEDDRLLLEGLCGQIAIAMQSAELVKTIRENEANLEEAAAIAQLGYWEFDALTDTYTFTDQFYALLRTTVEREGGYQMSSKEYVRKFMHPADSYMVSNEIQKSIKAVDEDRIEQFENRFIRADGTEGYVTGRSRVIKDAQGRTVKTVGFNQDITERKQAEEALRRSEQLMRTVIDSTPDWIFIKDQEHRYQLANKGYANALHIALEDFIGKNDLDLGFPEELVKGNPEKGIRGFWTDDRLVMDSNEPQVYPDDPATIDGMVHNFHTIKVPLRNADGKAWGVLAFARDITERKQAEEALRRSEQEMAERLEEIKHLYQAMSRDGWKTYRETTDLPTGFMFDQTGTKPVEDQFLMGEPYINVPMAVLGGEVVGTLAVANDPSHPTSPEDQAFLRQVSDQIALALEAARLSAQTKSALAQTETLSDAGLRFARAADLQELIKIAVETLEISTVNRAVLETFNYNSSNELDSMDIVANWWNGTGHEPTDVGTRYTSEILPVMHLFVTSTPIFLNDVFTDERVDSITLEIVKRLNIRSLAVLPLYVGTRQLGVMLLESEDVYHFKEDETRLFTAMGPQIATVLENRRQFARAQQQAERESMLNIISQKIQSATTVEAVLQIAARELGHALGAPMTIAQLSMKDKK